MSQRGTVQQLERCVSLTQHTAASVTLYFHLYDAVSSVTPDRSKALQRTKLLVMPRPGPGPGAGPVSSRPRRPRWLHAGYLGYSSRSSSRTRHALETASCAIDKSSADRRPTRSNPFNVAAPARSMLTESVRARCAQSTPSPAAVYKQIRACTWQSSRVSRSNYIRFGIGPRAHTYRPRSVDWLSDCVGLPSEGRATTTLV